MISIKNTKPAEDAEGLRRQFFALRMLVASLESQLKILTEKDYSLSEERVRLLEQSLESEKQMNAQLTSEIIELELKSA